MKPLQDFTVFIAAAKYGSFSKAANALDLTPAAVSAVIKRLEKQFDCVLFVRSTRSLRITDDGSILLKQCQLAIDAINDGLNAVQQQTEELTGDIKLSMPSDIGRHLILPWLDEFIDKHPNIHINVELSDSFTNMYKSPVDISLRYGIPQDSNLIALPISKTNTRVLCASPEYLKQHKTPKHPDDLKHLNCLRFVFSGALESHWSFNKGDEKCDVAIAGNRTANDGDAIKNWSVMGKGISYKSLLDISEELKQGKLSLILQDWTGSPAPFYMMCADKRQLNPAVKALRAFLVEKCEAQLASIARY